MSDSILSAIHETAKGLTDAGVMEKTTMREFDALCLPPVKRFSAVQIKGIREHSRASQKVFAAHLNTNVSTVRQWESGDKKPNGPSLKLLNLVDSRGLEVLA